MLAKLLTVSQSCCSWVCRSVHLAQLGAVPHDEFIGCDQHIELQRLDFCGILPGALILVPDVIHTPHIWQPLRELRLPVDDDSIGHNDEVGPKNILVLHQEGQQSHDLQRYSTLVARKPQVILLTDFASSSREHDKV